MAGKWRLEHGDLAKQQAELAHTQAIADANLEIAQQRYAQALAEQARTEQRIRQSQALRHKP